MHMWGRLTSNELLLDMVRGDAKGRRWQSEVKLVAYAIRLH